MQKAYIGKETNSISQLIPDTYDRFGEYDKGTFGERYYMVVIPDDKHLDSHDYYYKPDTGEFEHIEGITSLDHKAKIEPSKIEQLEEENIRLNNKLDEILNLIEGSGIK